MVVVAVTMDYLAAIPSIDQTEIFKFCRLCNFDDNAVLFLHDNHTPSFFFIENRGNLYLITSGIKQGSGPGTVLYAGGSNSVDTVVRFYWRKSFVDDEDFYLGGLVDDLPGVIERVNIDLEAVAQWAKTANITVNIDKTKVLIFGSTANLKRLSAMVIPPVVLNNQALPLSSGTKNLGVFLPPDLS